MKKYVLLYQLVEDATAKALQHEDAHRAYRAQFYRSGQLELTGAFANEQQDGTMAVFGTSEAAEAFVENDPFVLHGVVASWRILEWNEILAQERRPGGTAI